MMVFSTESTNVSFNSLHEDLRQLEPELETDFERPGNDNEDTKVTEDVDLDRPIETEIVE